MEKLTRILLCVIFFELVMLVGIVDYQNPISGALVAIGLIGFIGSATVLTIACIEYSSGKGKD